MCVIYVAKKALPEDSELSRGSVKNPDGAGVAWVAPHPEQSGVQMIHWKKGLKDAKEVKEFINDKKLPLPLVIHFRTASVGPKVPELTHPFPIMPGVPLWQEGCANEVLFHNGTLSNWEDLVLNVGLKSTQKFPEGDWSDSRALAWLTHLKGPGVLNFLSKSSRIALFYPKAGGQIHLYGSGWIRKDDYSQSCTTDYFNRGGSRVYMGGRFWEDEEVSMGKDLGEVKCHIPSAPEPPPTPVEEKKTGKVTEIRGGGRNGNSQALALVAVDDEDVWPLEQLKAILKQMQEEQNDAVIASGI